ncbi:hypothetical protein [Paenibacillus wenxiniae]|uniref:Uncharacterized protein n=1 Tax=Paenibacillus wenxiniae TaxID=1636843 RepID=A0ABW4RD09_9BACL
MSFMKKVITVSILASFGLASVGLSSTLSRTYAANLDSAQSQPELNFNKDDMVITYQAKEIKDLNELERRAKAGISDLDQSEMSLAPKLNLNSVENQKSNESEVVRTAQILQTAERADGTKVNRVAITSFSSDGNKYSSSNDSTLGNKAYSTIYTDDWFDPRGVKYLTLVRVTGGWQLEGNNVSIASGTITAGQAGPVYGGVGYSEAKTWNVSGTSFDYTLPTTWKPVAAKSVGSAAGTVIGVTTKVVYKRGNATWSHDLTNNM